MIQDSPELVAMKCALGQQLAALREAAGMVQQQIGHQTGYSRSSVAKAEGGHQLLTPRFWSTADELLKADGALLASYERVRAAEQEHDARSREAELAKAYAEAQARAQELQAAAAPFPQGAGGLVVPTGQELVAELVASVGAELAGSLAGPLLYLAFLTSPGQAGPPEWGDQLHEQLRTFLQGWANTMERREHLRLLGYAAATVAASPIINLDCDEQERLVKAIAVPSRVDDRVIDSVEAILQHCKQQNDAYGAQAVLYTVLGQRNFVRTLLNGCRSEFRPRLLSIYSSMSCSLGLYFFDLNDAASAMHYCDQARADAQEARNTELAVNALCCMSYFASWQGKAHAGLDFAAAAQSLVNKTDDALLQALAADRAGVAYAADGQHKECMTEFDRALTEFASSTGRISPESPAYWYHEGAIHSQQSNCLLWLGKPAEAAASASRGLQLFDNSFVGNLAYCTLRLGTARLLSGEVEEAARLVSDGALLATQYRTARLTKEVQTARARMQPWHDMPAVRALDERMAAWGLV